MFSLLETGAESWVMTSFKLQKVIFSNSKTSSQPPVRPLLSPGGGDASKCRWHRTSHVVDADTVVCWCLDAVKLMLVP